MQEAGSGISGSGRAEENMSEGWGHKTALVCR